MARLGSGVRVDYQRVRAALAEEAFFEPLHRWHERHGLTIGVDQQSLNGGISAIRDLLQQAPPAVIASMLGYHPSTAETLAAQAGASWQRYATSRTHTPAHHPRQRAVDVFGDAPPG